MPSVETRELNRKMQDAVNHLSGGRIAPAKAVLRGILQSNPLYAEALQLMGMVARQEGELAHAEHLFRQSLLANPKLPHVHNNLANLLNREGRLNEAIEAYREALRLKPDYVDAWINLGLTYAALGRHEDALQAYSHALKLQPTSVKAFNAKGLALQALGRLVEAEAAFLKAVNLAPQDLKSLNNLGNLLRRRGDEAEAAACFERALALAPVATHLRVALAGAYFNLGRFEEAERQLLDTLAQEPANIDAHWTLTTLRHATNKIEQIPESYETALDRIPRVVDLWSAYVGTLWQLDRYEASLEVLDRAIRACGNHPAFNLWRGRILVSAGDPQCALACLDPDIDGTEGLPGHQVIIERVRAYLQMGEFQRGASELAPVAYSDPADYSLWAYLELLWRLAGDDRAFWLLDYDRFVRLMEVPVPQGFSSHKEFNRAVRECLEPLHMTQVPPLNQTERGGSKTYGKLFERTERLITLLRNAIKQTIFEYLEGLPLDSAHPFLRHNKETSIRFSGSWSVRLFGEGYHIPHYHPEGWISSAYYVSLPASVANTSTIEGRIHFGTPPVPVPCTDTPVKVFQPEVGKLALFPSYCWHGTYPFRASEHRFTVAFDVARSEDGH